MELGKNVTILHSIDRAVTDVYVRKIADILAPTYDTSDSTPVPVSVFVDMLTELDSASSLLTCMFTGNIPTRIPGRTRIYLGISPRCSMFLRVKIWYGTGAMSEAKFNPRKLTPVAVAALAKLVFKHQLIVGNIPTPNLVDKVRAILSRGTNPPPYDPTKDVLGPGLFAVKRHGITVTTDDSGNSITNKDEAALYMEKLPEHNRGAIKGIGSGAVSGVVCSERYRDYLNSEQFTDADRTALARLFKTMASQAQFRTGYIPN